MSVQWPICTACSVHSAVFSMHRAVCCVQCAVFSKCQDHPCARWQDSSIPKFLPKQRIPQHNLYLTALNKIRTDGVSLHSTQGSLHSTQLSLHSTQLSLHSTQISLHSNTNITALNTNITALNTNITELNTNITALNTNIGQHCRHELDNENWSD